MLHLPKNKTTTLKVPLVSATSTDADTLRLVGTIDLTPIDVPVSVVATSAIWLAISVTIPSITAGEYRYELLNNGAVVSQGLAIVRVNYKGDFAIAFDNAFNKDNANIIYNEQEEYIQYAE